MHYKYTVSLMLVNKTAKKMLIFPLPGTVDSAAITAAFGNRKDSLVC